MRTLSRALALPCWCERICNRGIVVQLMASMSSSRLSFLLVSGESYLHFLQLCMQREN